MNHTDRAKVILNLEMGARWLNTIPHDIGAIVHELHRQARASASLVSGKRCPLEAPDPTPVDNPGTVSTDWMDL